MHRPRPLGTDLPMLRWLALLALAIFLLASPERSDLAGWLTVTLAAACLLHLLPSSWRTAPRFDVALGVADTGLFLVVLQAAVDAPTAYVGAFAVAATVGALSGGILRSAVAGIAVGGIYVVATVLAGGGVPLVASLALFPAIALYAASLCDRADGHGETVREARRQSREFKALLEINDAVTSTLDLPAVMDRIVRLVGAEVGAERCSILLADEARDDCYVVAASDNPDVEMLKIDLAKYPEVRRAIESREPVLIDDVEADPLLASVRDSMEGMGYRSLMVLPLVFGRDVLGTLFLRATRSRPFTDQEIRFCRVAAGASANALKNALLYREASAESERHRTTWRKLRLVLDGSPDLIAATDIDGRVTEWNRGATRITGVAESEARGRRIEQLLAGAVPPSATETGPQRLDIRLDGEEGPREIDLVHAPLVREDGSARGRVWLGRDLTHQRKVERRLAHAERLSSVGGLAAGVAHELNNPLSAVLGYAQLLQATVEEPRWQRDLSRIVESAKRCERIIHNLLSFAREHRPEKKVADLDACVRKVVDLKSYHLRASHVEMRLQLDPNLPRGWFDFHQIEQVLLNLVHNAEQAISSGAGSGTITIRTGCAGDRIFVEVRDDGPGVPEELRDRIFDPFFTTKEAGHGTGLGLSVSYGIVEEHGGRLELLDGDGEGGASFRLELPVAGEEADAEEGASAPEASGPDAASAFAGRRILVADDEREVGQLLARVLQREGAQVTVTEDGEEAWQCLAKADFDLIVTDLRMPRLDGRGLYQRLADRRPDLLERLIFATGDLVRSDTVGFLEGLPNRILAKPLDVETIRRVVAQALGASSR